MWPETVRKSDLRIDFYRGSGAGGQKRNKTSNCCRITHLPTGLSAYAEDTRSASKNRSLAFRRLVEKLHPLMVEALTTRPPAPKMELVRTYHDKRGVKDHRTGDTVPYSSPLDDRIIDMVSSSLNLAPIAQ